MKVSSASRRCAPVLGAGYVWQWLGRQNRQMLPTFFEPNEEATLPLMFCCNSNRLLVSLTHLFWEHPEGEHIQSEPCSGLVLSYRGVFAAQK